MVALRDRVCSVVGCSIPLALTIARKCGHRAQSTALGARSSRPSTSKVASPPRSSECGVSSSAARSCLIVDGARSGGGSASIDSMRTHELERSAMSSIVPRPGIEETARPHGELRPVDVSEGHPSPARVETVPSGVTRRTQWLPESATKSTPSASTARPLGAWKAAWVPTPSACRGAPQPARVATRPSGVILASECEWYDDTYTVASEPPCGTDSMCTAMPYGESSGVSESRAPSVETRPERETARTQLLE